MAQQFPVAIQQHKSHTGCVAAALLTRFAARSSASPTCCLAQLLMSFMIEVDGAGSASLDTIMAKSLWKIPGARDGMLADTELPADGWCPAPVTYASLDETPRPVTCNLYQHKQGRLQRERPEEVIKELLACRCNVQSASMLLVFTFVHC